MSRHNSYALAGLLTITGGACLDEVAWIEEWGTQDRAAWKGGKRGKGGKGGTGENRGKGGKGGEGGKGGKGEG